MSGRLRRTAPVEPPRIESPRWRARAAPKTTPQAAAPPSSSRPSSRCRRRAGGSHRRDPTAPTWRRAQPRRPTRAAAYGHAALVRPPDPRPDPGQGLVGGRLVAGRSLKHLVDIALVITHRSPLPPPAAAGPSLTHVELDCTLGQRHRHRDLRDRQPFDVVQRHRQALSRRQCREQHSGVFVEARPRRSNPLPRRGARPRRPRLTSEVVPHLVVSRPAAPRRRDCRSERSAATGDGPSRGVLHRVRRNLGVTARGRERPHERRIVAPERLVEPHGRGGGDRGARASFTGHHTLQAGRKVWGTSQVLRRDDGPML